MEMNGTSFRVCAVARKRTERSRPVAFGRFNFDDVRAVAGEQSAGPWSRNPLGKFDDSDSVEWLLPQ